MLINGKFRCAGCMKKLSDEFIVCDCGYDNKNDSNHVHCLQVGTVLDDAYVIGKVIGEGGFGITYVGWDRDLDKKVAIKEFFMNGYTSRNSEVSPFLRANIGDETEIFEQNKEKFVNEAKILASLMEERGIVTVYKFFRENNTAYIVMEYVEGNTLKEYIAIKGKLSVDETIGIVGPVMNSLAKIHEKKLIHRDISPDNIMITSDGRGVLIDFGAARDISEKNRSLSVVLKHGFAPMEQYQSRGNQGPWTDVYALSAVIYKCITGKVPVEATKRVMSDTLESICDCEESCSVAVSDVISKGLSVDISKRYQSVDEFKRAIIDALNGKVQEEGIKDNVPRRKLHFAILGVCLLGIASGSLIFYSDLKGNNEQKEIVSEVNDYDENTLILNTLTEVGNDGDLQDDEEVLSDSENATISEITKDSAVNDVVLFGHYNQEEIEWIVLTKEEEKLLLVSRSILDYREYNDSVNCSWEESSIRAWLNGQFMDTAFDDSEKDCILLSELENEDNMSVERLAGSNTMDKVFLLSLSECKKYFKSKSDRNPCKQGNDQWWWLRTSGKINSNAVAVYGGSIDDDGNYVTCQYGIRPAIWVDVSD